MTQELLAPLHDPARLAALQQAALLDTPAEAAFDRLARLAVRMLHVPVALVSLVDEDRQFFKSCVGLSEPWASQRATPLSHSFCQYTVASREPLIINDARAHPLVHDSLAIADLKVVAYAGIPLITSDGHALGSFCAIDSEPRVWTKDDVEFLRELAASVMAEIELRNEIRERKQVEEALRQAKQEADAANQAKSEFLSRMSHELRTPLNAILGFAQLLELDDLDPLQHDSVDHILKGGRHLLGLINEVLDLARVETGHLSLSIEPVALYDVLAEAHALIRPLAGTRNVHLADPPAACATTQVLADQQRLKQVLLNLLANAVKYNRPGGSIALTCRQTADERLRVEVRDTGPGIPEAKLARLFTPFDRLGAEQTDVEGTGLGLALSRHLVELMGGRIGVESMVGQGSTFWVELAVAASEAALTAEGEPRVDGGNSETATHSATCTVLYIEDNLSNLRLVEQILRHRPAVDLVAAMQGGLGLELAREHQPALILLDLHLPDLSGQEVLRRLRAEPRTQAIPVVVLSADATPGHVEQLRAAGADAYLTKPLDVQQFLAVVDELIAKWSGHAG